MAEATIMDVALHAGVSRAAVSKVIRGAYGVSPQMRERVQESISELGYRPRTSARAMRGRSFTLGVELPSTTNDFFDGVLRGCQTELDQTPYDIIIAPVGVDHDNGPQAIQRLADHQVDGILAVSPAVTQPFLEDLAERFPLVMLGRHDVSEHYDTIVCDDTLGADLALEHLASLGHRRITHLTIDPRYALRLPQAPHALRDAAYRRFMGADEARRPHLNVVYTDPTAEAVYEAALDLLQSLTRPSAVFAGHDELALAVMRAAAELRLSRNDLSVIGFDDTDFAAHPLVSLSSVAQSAEEIGRLAMRFLLERIGGRTHALHHMVTPELRPRRSTTRPSTTDTQDDLTRK